MTPRLENCGGAPGKCSTTLGKGRYLRRAKVHVHPLENPGKKKATPSPWLPYGRQWVDSDDVKAVVRVLRSDWITQGPEVDLFEREFATVCGAKYAVAVSSGTAALHLACLAAGLKAGETLITSPITFLASANCGLYCGASVAFADVQPDVPLLSPANLEQALRLLGRRAHPKVLVPVHYGGFCCNMEAIAEIAERHKLTIIEDGCHALGAQWRDSRGVWRKIGSCSHSLMTVFSFHPVKHVTTAEGGMITTNSREIYEQLKRLRSHGTQRPKPSAGVDPWVYEMRELGFNYRLTDVQCALGRSQLRKLQTWVHRRRAIMELYRHGLADCDHLCLLTEPAGQRASYHLAVIRARGPDAASRRRKLFDHLVSKGIGVQVHYIPIYRQPLYRQRFGFDPANFPNAEAFYASCLSLPMFPRMTDADARKVIETIRAFSS